MNFSLSRIALFLILLVAVCSPLSAAEAIDPQELSPERIAALAGKLEIGAAQIKSLRVRVTARYQSAQFFCDVYTNDRGDGWLVVCDAIDGTPLLICTDNRALIFDLTKRAVVIFDEAHFEFTLGDGDAQAGGDGNAQTDISFLLREAKNKVTVDLQSVMKNTPNNLTAVKEGKRWVLQGQTQRGGTVVAHVAPDALVPFLDMKIFLPKQLIPVVIVGPIQVNKAPEVPAPKIPRDESLSPRLGIVHIRKAATSPQELGNEIDILQRTITCKMAGRDPRLREELWRKSGKPVDWARIAAEDDELSDFLKDRFGEYWVRTASTTQPTN